MGIFCSNCNLNYRIEEYRARLNNIIVEKEYNLLDGEVINLSQSLDDLVYKCTFCEKNLNRLSRLNTHSYVIKKTVLRSVSCR